MSKNLSSAVVVIGALRVKKFYTDMCYEIMAFLVLQFTLQPGNIFVLKMLSAFNVCCIYSNALQTRFCCESKHYEP